MQNLCQLGLGTWADPSPAPEAVIKAVLEAIELGYRMFDTASAYETEENNQTKDMLQRVKVNMIKTGAKGSHLSHEPLI